MLACNSGKKQVTALVMNYLAMSNRYIENKELFRF